MILWKQKEKQVGNQSLQAVFTDWLDKPRSESKISQLICNY